MLIKTVLLQGSPYVFKLLLLQISQKQPLNREDDNHFTFTKIYCFFSEAQANLVL